MKGQSGNTILKAGVIGTIIAALCCFTPVLAVLLGVVGLGALTGCLDYLLLPALIIFVCMIVYGITKMGKGTDACCGSRNDDNKESCEIKERTRELHSADKAMKEEEKEKDNGFRECS